jgi:signal transduction histidine kinase
VVTAAIPVERTNVPHLALQVRVDDTTILAGVNLYSDASLRLADAEVEITGVAGGLFSRQRQLLRGVLLVESEDDIRVISAPRSPRSIPVQTIGELFRFRPNGHLGHRVRVQGTYLGGPADGWLAIQDQTGGVFIETEQSLADLQPGDRLELIGFPTRRAQTLWLENAEILERMSGTPPGPTVKSFAEGIDRPGQLARLTGDVIGLPRPGENAWVVTLSDQGGNSFDVHVSPAADRYPTEWREGAQLTVTGIAEAYTRSGVSHDLFPFPSDLRVHVRSLDDVVVERAPPWHTSKVFAALLMRTLVVIALVLGAVLMVVILLARKNAALRETRRRLHEAREELARRFSARTGEWQQELAARHAAEADFALLTAERIRLARELHDTLEQSMASVALQLDAVHGFYHEQPKQALVLLEQATHTLRESQAEVRRSVWNLRSLKLEETTLPDALDQLSESLHATQGPAIEFACEGSPWTLPPLVASHLFRIAQEAVTNALKHADARRIRLLLAFEPTLLELSIQDDGRGFATETVLEEGHFGLAGMQERATALEADLRIVSSADTGTSLHVRVFRDRLGPFPP